MIRPAHPADRDALYAICLATGDGGSDATGLYDDPELLGHVYLGPYLALAPDLAFVVTAGTDGRGGVGGGTAGQRDGATDDRPLGYCVGAADTVTFTRACEQRWWPGLRRAYPLQPERRAPDQGLVEMIHHPPVTDPAVVAGFPGHLHIDLLPAAQGRGAGRALIGRFLAALVDAGCPGVHLGVAEDNARAIAFYRKVGFADLARAEGTRLMGMDLSGATRGGPGQR